MTYQQIYYFLALCETGSFANAARKCGVRQPTVSVIIRRLERELGGTLIVRSNPIQLTALGAALLPYLMTIQEAVVRARNAAALHVPILSSEEGAGTADIRRASLP